MPHAGRARPTRAVAAAILAALFVSGCAIAPSINVLGAYFPGWLFCIVAGVVLTVIVSGILQRLHADVLLRPAALIYPTLVLLLALAAWLLLFQH
jgi:hypothetical protein